MNNAATNLNSEDAATQRTETKEENAKIESENLEAVVRAKKDLFRDKDFTGNVELVIDETSRAVAALAR